MNIEMDMYIQIIGHDTNLKLLVKAEMLKLGTVAFTDDEKESVKFDVMIFLDSESLVNYYKKHSDSKSINPYLIIPGGVNIVGESSRTLKWESDQATHDEVIAATIRNIVHSLAYKKLYPMTCNKRVIKTYQNAKRVSTSKAPVLIHGETGTGKEILAKYIHENSSVSDGSFVAVNCAAIPESMVEAILFGYERGAFTGAVQNHVGKFERANNGTIFLDEIGEMPLNIQAKLLRVLQDHEIERLGSKMPFKLNIRVIAATNKDLKKEAECGNFRWDLYYRLNVVSLECISLRERKEDIENFANFFRLMYQQLNHLKNVPISDEVMANLISYEWPGNIRQLENTIHRAVILNDDHIIDHHDIDIELIQSVNHSDHSSNDLKMKEAEVIVNVLKSTKGCRSLAAKHLNISPRTLRYKIQKLKETGILIP